MPTHHRAQRIEHRPIDDLKSARKRGAARIAQRADSIATFGFNSTILVDSKAGVISGYGRVLAARKLQLETVPVVVLGHPSETQKPADMLAVHRGGSK